MAASSSSSSHAASRPLVRPLFLSKPLHPPQTGPAAAGGGSGGGGGGGGAFPLRPTAAVANPSASVYIRSANATAAFAASPQPRPLPLSPSPADAGSHPTRSSHPFAIPRRTPAPPTSSPGVNLSAAPALPKVAPLPAVSLALENSNFNDRERSREDTLVMLHGRKVRMSEGGSGSLYALCRSWVKNGLPQESQPNNGDSLRILPKPLPASAVNSQLLKQSEETNEAEDSGKEEDITSSEQLSAHDLLKEHMKRAKRVRARFRKERLLRIERYKRRLSLLLPTQIELIARNDATPKR